MCAVVVWPAWLWSCVNGWAATMYANDRVADLREPASIVSTRPFNVEANREKIMKNVRWMAIMHALCFVIVSCVVQMWKTDEYCNKCCRKSLFSVFYGFFAILKWHHLLSAQRSANKIQSEKTLRVRFLFCADEKSNTMLREWNALKQR